MGRWVNCPSDMPVNCTEAMMYAWPNGGLSAKERMLAVGRYTSVTPLYTAEDACK